MLMSILALYNHDNTIFDNLQLPSGVTKTTVVNNLLLELAELEILYTNPNDMKLAIGFWSTKEMPVWVKLYETLNYDYNPIENYNLTEVTNEVKDHDYTNVTGNETSGNITLNRTDGTTNKETRNLQGTDSGTETLTGHSHSTGNTVGSGTTDDTIDRFVYGFNSNTAANASRDVQAISTSTTNETDDDNTTNNTTTHNNNTTDTGTVDDVGSLTSNIRTDTTSNSDINNTQKGTDNRDLEINRKGNIGVTSTQDLITQERELALFNLYDFIIQSFKCRFCLMVY